ncbi:thymidine phosphorylase family protein [Leptospira noguchii]|uniref:thymidine phosphorylase n=1 Tax=Leptospira noguchii TaxID=28182 RepID=A0A9Q8VSW9_9LEPT|nr:thymidine phosphorylase family protein [Leptospira noguchii]EKR75476.1 putative thymidine phosphorylase [Leptospira noguchii str. 2006001870]EMS89639.1 putative thymidine phosphorylase [Leptospira noguchii str. Hook]TQE73533.1 thymidine phosphorylase family protein [Leptospira noguchii]UOG33791.1 thymidine phosphorylase family protein [Leptospira noguchii]UOG41255.1 thymidine phosphorylase family protein [Leptospira noguchii]
MSDKNEPLTLKNLGIDTNQEYVVFLRRDCPVCTSEGFVALNRIEVKVGSKKIIASLNIIETEILQIGQVGLSESAWKAIHAKEGDKVILSHLQPVLSMHDVRAKIYENRLNEDSFRRIIQDIKDEKYSNIEIASFITACSGDHLNLEEIKSLTKAMIGTGLVLKWKNHPVVDKHCVGGLPGNRTTPIVVSIITAMGLTFPKTSSRAITSPAGTADTIESITKVNLNVSEMKSVVEQEGGCIVWGGSIGLSPVDDILIRVERALEVDSVGQMIASVLSKKAAAGSSHVVIDIPVGKTAKIRSEEDAEKLKYYFTVVGKSIGLKIKVLISDGSQPVGRGIGPSLEIKDCIEVLNNDPLAPQDLKKRALSIAGAMLEFAQPHRYKNGDGLQAALDILESGKAFKKFESICKAQGDFKIPPTSKFRRDIVSKISGVVLEIDNRKIAKVARLAGAPNSASAGVDFLSPIGKKIEKGDILYTVHSDSEGELEYAFEYMNSQENIIVIS